MPSTSARSLPQMPARRGRSRSHSGVGSGSASSGSRLSGPTVAPRPGMNAPASRAAANRAGFRENTNRLIRDPPSRYQLGGEWRSYRQ